MEPRGNREIREQRDRSKAEQVAEYMRTIGAEWANLSKESEQ